MNLFQEYLASEFAEDYQEGRISRREALRLIASVTGSAVVANTILAACTPRETVTATLPVENAASATPEPTEPAAAALATETMPVTETAAVEPQPAQTLPAAEGGEPTPFGTVSPDDPAVTGSSVTFPGDDGAALSGYFAVPAAGEPRGTVLVCHENRGLTAHIEDVTRRLAKAGYAALAVDLLSRQGGTAAVGNDNVPGALGSIAPDQFVRDFRSGVDFLSQQEGVPVQRLGMVGFCFGGGVTWRAATQMPDLQAAVPYYGPHPSVEDVPNIQAAVLAVYAELDTRINSGIPTIEAAMLENNKIFEKIIFPGADHAFHNDTTTRYNPSAAVEAWSRTLDWFERYLI